VQIRPIHTKEDHDAALRRIEALWGAPEGSVEGDELDILATLVERYEEARWPVEHATPLGMIEFYMEQNGYTQSDLAKLLGSRSRASEILNGKRELTLDQIRLLSRHWRIPAGLLVGGLQEV
jgi:HTH-type transcriptional regulator/antitoxin HigA